MRALSSVLLKGKTGGAAQFLNYCIGYCAVASSSAANVYAMRMGEMDSGVTVKDEEGRDYGQSKVAAEDGIYKTMISRVVYSVPIFFTPAACNMLLTKAKVMPK